jgi:hypothetical protein
VPGPETNCGIPGIGKLPWGNHFCHFFETGDDLVQSLIPYFLTGLLQDERCIWGCATPLQVDQAREALAKQLPDIDRYLKDDRLIIFDHQEWYRRSDKDPLPILLEEEEKTLARGLRGLRCGGNCSWLGGKDHVPFMNYEGRISRAIRSRRILALCSYNVGTGRAPGIMEAMRLHDYTLSKGDYGWDLLERLRHV